MPTLTITYATDADRFALEQAIAFVTQLRHLAATAPAGAVLDACEQAAPTDGRALLRDGLGAAPRDRIAADQQKGGPHASAPRRTPHATRGSTRGTC